MSDRSHEETLTAEEVAARLKCTTRHLRKLVAGEKVPSPSRLGTRVRWRAADVDRFIACGLDMERFNAGATVIPMSA